RVDHHVPTGAVPSVMVGIEALRGVEDSGRTDPKPALGHVAGRPQRPDAKAGVGGAVTRKEARAVRAELDRLAVADGQVRDGGAGERVPEPEAVGGAREQQAAVGAEVEGVMAELVKPGRAVAYHTVVQRTTLSAIGQVPEPEVGGILLHRHLPIIGADSDE